MPSVARRRTGLILINIGERSVELPTGAWPACRIANSCLCDVASQLFYVFIPREMLVNSAVLITLPRCTLSSVVKSEHVWLRRNLEGKGVTVVCALYYLWNRLQVRSPFTTCTPIQRWWNLSMTVNVYRQFNYINFFKKTIEPLIIFNTKNGMNIFWSCYYLRLVIHQGG